MKILVLLVLFSVLIYQSEALTLGHPQSISVKGKLLCNGKPEPKVKVKLYDEDDMDPDDLMAEGRTDANGTFHLSGSEWETTTIDPKVMVYHDCEDHNREGLRKFTIYLPKDHITQGEKPDPKKEYDMGIINLEGIMPGEGRDFIN